MHGARGTVRGARWPFDGRTWPGSRSGRRGSDSADRGVRQLTGVVYLAAVIEVLFVIAAVIVMIWVHSRVERLLREVVKDAREKFGIS
jgi:hypothetical protein